MLTPLPASCALVDLSRVDCARQQVRNASRREKHALDTSLHRLENEDHHERESSKDDQGEDKLYSRPDYARHIVRAFL